jgi:foldase protein PrsA
VWKGVGLVGGVIRCVCVVVGVFVVVGVVACGGTADGGGLSGGVIVRVGGRSVSRAALDHWVPIEAIISRVPDPQQPVARGLVPDPPAYTACVAFMRATPPRLGGAQAGSTVAQLKSACQKRYEDVRGHMLRILITYAWTNAEAALQGVSVSDSEMKQRFDRFKREQFPTEAMFQKFLRYTGESLADELWLTRFDLLSTKIEKKILLKGGIAGATKYYKEFPKRWAAKTSCSPGYIIPNCKQYKGPQPPEAAI